MDRYQLCDFNRFKRLSCLTTLSGCNPCRTSVDLSRLFSWLAMEDRDVMSFNFAFTASSQSCKARLTADDRHVAAWSDLEGNLRIDSVPGVHSLTLFLCRSRCSHGCTSRRIFLVIHLAKWTKNGRDFVLLRGYFIKVWWVSPSTQVFPPSQILCIHLPLSPCN